MDYSSIANLRDSKVIWTQGQAEISVQIADGLNPDLLINSGAEGLDFEGFLHYAAMNDLADIGAKIHEGAISSVLGPNLYKVHPSGLLVLFVNRKGDADRPNMAAEMLGKRGALFDPCNLMLDAPVIIIGANKNASMLRSYEDREMWVHEFSHFISFRMRQFYFVRAHKNLPAETPAENEFRTILDSSRNLGHLLPPEFYDFLLDVRHLDNSLGALYTHGLKSADESFIRNMNRRSMLDLLDFLGAYSVHLWMDEFIAHVSEARPGNINSLMLQLKNAYRLTVPLVLYDEFASAQYSILDNARRAKMATEASGRLIMDIFAATEFDPEVRDQIFQLLYTHSADTVGRALLNRFGGIIERNAKGQRDYGRIIAAAAA